VSPPVVRDKDRDAVPDETDNCPDATNGDQADRDGDKLGDVCDPFDNGNQAPQVGVTTNLEVVAGEVFVKLPAHMLLGVDGLRARFQETGFQPLKGRALLALGATVDTRKGAVASTTAANGFPLGDKRARLQSARISAAIFTMRQKRASRAQKG